MLHSLLLLTFNPKLAHLIKKVMISASLLVVSSVSQATIVQFETPFGNFEVNLYDEITPETVNNFLNYVEDGAYTNAIFHRSVNNFVLQGGGFYYDTQWPLLSVPANAPVVNEPELSNVRGTIAMAKLGNDPNSATNQWFFNLNNNAGNLDFQNDGFTVFGEVMGDGMQVIDQIAALQKWNFGGALTDLPLQNYSGTGNPNETHLALIQSITIIDSASNTAQGTNPPLTIRSSRQDDTNSGGGATFVLTLLLMLLMTIRPHLNR